ncbi:MAG: AAA family ATPase, partial [Oscillospiraceae bacterium]
MLSELHIKNFAIINEANVKFTEGLNIFTGETGTGKSVIIKAVIAVLGGPFRKDMIKMG